MLERWFALFTSTHNEDPPGGDWFLACEIRFVGLREDKEPGKVVRETQLNASGLGSTARDETVLTHHFWCEQKMDVDSGPRPASVGQYGPTSPGRCGIDGIYGNVYSVTYEASMCGSASILTSRPNHSRIPNICERNTGIWGDVFLTLTGAGTIEELFLSTTQPLSFTPLQKSHFDADLVNQGAQPPVQSMLRGRIGDLRFERLVRWLKSACKR